MNLAADTHSATLTIRLTTMNERRSEPSASLQHAGATQSFVHYPEKHVLAIVDSRDQLATIIESLTSSGFLASEVSVSSGQQAADALKETTGRTGLANLVIRVATKLGLQDEESETKDRYQKALHDGQYVVAVSTPTDERKELAAQLLASHGGHFLNYLGHLSIERLSG